MKVEERNEDGLNVREFDCLNVEDEDGSSVEQLSNDEETQNTQTNEVIKQSNGESHQTLKQTR